MRLFLPVAATIVALTSSTAVSAGDRNVAGEKRDFVRDTIEGYSAEAPNGWGNITDSGPKGPSSA